MKSTSLTSRSHLGLPIASGILWFATVSVPAAARPAPQAQVGPKSTPIPPATQPAPAPRIFQPIPATPTNPNTQDPLDDAVGRGNLAAAQAAIAADPTLVTAPHDGRSLLITAIRDGHLDLEQLLLANGADPNQAEGRSPRDTPFVCALDQAQFNWKQMASALIAKGANVNKVDLQGNTPLLLLVSQSLGYNGENVSDRIQFLLDNNADVTLRDHSGTNVLVVALNDASANAFETLLPHCDGKMRDSDGNTLLMLAVQRNKPDMVRPLLAHGADLNAQDNGGDTALHFAAAHLGPMVKQLLDAGANANIADFNGDIPLHIALRGASASHGMAWLGAESGGSPFLRANFRPANGVESVGLAPVDEPTVSSRGILLAPLTEKSDVNLKDQFGITPLLIAILARDQESRDLIADKAPREDTITQLFDAIAQGNLETVQNLIARKPYLTYLRLSDGSTPLHIAALWGSVTVAEYLVKQGADVNARDARGRTPLLMALQSPSGRFLHRAKVMEAFLLANGADVNALDTDGLSTLQLAARANDVELVTPLLELHPRIDDRDATGSTALMTVLENRGSAAMVGLLLDQGAAVNVHDAAGVTPLMICAGQHDKGEVQLLLDKGADATAHSRDGGSALCRLLNPNGYGPDLRDIAALLLAKGADPNEIIFGESFVDAMIRNNADGADAMLKVLLASGRVHLTIPQYKRAFLTDAVFMERVDAVKALLAAGADPNDGGGGQTPISAARTIHDHTILELLLAKGAMG